MNFTWIDQFDAGCIDRVAKAIPIRVAKVRWLEKKRFGFQMLTGRGGLK
jgi:hypothetical protein